MLNVTNNGPSELPAAKGVRPRLIASVVQVIPARAAGWCVETIFVVIPIASISLRLRLEVYMSALISCVGVMWPKKTK
jgi:hypothetical protein